MALRTHVRTVTFRWLVGSSVVACGRMQQRGIRIQEEPNGWYRLAIKPARTVSLSAHSRTQKGAEIAKLLIELCKRTLRYSEDRPGLVTSGHRLRQIKAFIKTTELSSVWFIRPGFLAVWLSLLWCGGSRGRKVHLSLDSEAMRHA